MRRTILRLVTAVQLTRLTMAYGAIADVWLVILLTRADPAMADRPVSQLPIALALAAGLAVAVGLFTFGATLNDVLDARIDRDVEAGNGQSGQVLAQVGGDPGPSELLTRPNRPHILRHVATCLRV